MGQTLTHGVYLPDEGERNCYSGLAANLQILDTSVGTIAAHTAALSGKAPLAHTHVKADITDFPAYGTTAGTICEGNDSRLSDARTPVAHTHTKSDVTDLLNSNFIPSANNSYDLGSSSYQWNNLYAKNYYYNGVAWGLDKANTWSNVNTFSNTLSITGNTLFAWDRPQVTIGTIPSSIVFYGTTRFRDSNNTSYALERGAISTTWNYRQWFVHNFSNASINASFEIGINHDGTEKYFLINANKVIPNTTGVSDLGTSTNKWKTLNGINPGALSLPDMGNVENTNYFDFSGSITHLDGTDNFYTPTIDGWMTVIITGTSLSLFVDATSAQAKNQGVGISAAPVNGYCLATIPVRKNYRVKIQATGTSIYMAFVRPNLGNV